MRVLFWGLPHHIAPVERRLRAIAGVELETVTDEPAAIAGAASAEVLLMTPPRYSGGLEQAVLAAGRLRLVQLLSAGFDPLLKRSFPPGTAIATAGTSLAPAVAEHAMALALALVRRLDRAFANQSGTIWDRAPYTEIGTLEGRHAAIVGFGSIGKAIAARLRAFGVHVTGVSRSGGTDTAADAMRPIAALDDVLGEADLVFIALAASAETENLFDRARLERMKEGAMLVNIARGSIVDGLALAEALNAGRLGGAGIDVTEPEPLPSDHPLWRASNAIITPHYGGVGGQQRLVQFVATNLERFRDGAPLEAVIDLEAIKARNRG